MPKVTCDFGTEKLSSERLSTHYVDLLRLSVQYFTNSEGQVGVMLLFGAMEGLLNYGRYI